MHRNCVALHISNATFNKGTIKKALILLSNFWQWGYDILLAQKVKILILLKICQHIDMQTIEMILECFIEIDVVAWVYFTQKPTKTQLNSVHWELFAKTKTFFINGTIQIVKNQGKVWLCSVTLLERCSIDGVHSSMTILNLWNIETPSILTSFAGSTILSVIDKMNRSSPQVIKITNFFFDCEVFIREENIFWQLLTNCSESSKSRFEKFC